MLPIRLEDGSASVRSAPRRGLPRLAHVTRLRL